MYSCTPCKVSMNKTSHMWHQAHKSFTEQKNCSRPLISQHRSSIRCSCDSDNTGVSKQTYCAPRRLKVQHGQPCVGTLIFMKNCHVTSLCIICILNRHRGIYAHFWKHVGRKRGTSSISSNIVIHLLIGFLEGILFSCAWFNLIASYL